MTRCTVSILVTCSLAGTATASGQIRIGTHFGFFQLCLSGLGVPPTSPPCFKADLDGDNDVDVDDFAMLHGCMSGPDMFAGAHCAD
jgi:hypothetical protein